MNTKLPGPLWLGAWRAADDDARARAVQAAFAAAQKAGPSAP